MHSSLVNDQFDAHILYTIIRFLQSSTCFVQRCAHHQEVNCINTASGVFNLCRWQSGMQVEKELRSFSTYIPDGHLQKLTILDAVLIQLTS